ncbi:DUF202 domain-containing protein [Actinacidiphila sp. ITFR-21]|uniref:DUF202 domain-containing protein n=1 Tax=Actinacidiphila sp. ITFR-21 TaxID=3075199 RepID=UPI00288C4AB9|nr:DUF202 domain-containing protein [Streptomyces sp. ITFR-21]WNI14866.1 DUF202 domain-containing protein [Streptomyces sp. ITFR-21]
MSPRAFPPPDDGPAGRDPDRDPGLQPERTQLAWRRTTLSCAVAAVLALRQALRTGGGPLRAVAVCLVLLALVAFGWLAHVRIRRLSARRPPAMPLWAAVSVLGCTVALAVFGAALVL